MPLSQPVKDDLETHLEQIVALLSIAPYAPPSESFSGTVELVRKFEWMLQGVLDADPVAFIDYTQRLEKAWTEFVRQTNFAGLGPCAALLGRNR
jgi:hypothetical protein